VEMWKVEKLSDCHGSRKNAGGNNDCLCVSCQFSSIYLAGRGNAVKVSWKMSIWPCRRLFLFSFSMGGVGTYKKKQLMI